MGYYSARFLVAPKDVPALGAGATLTTLWSWLLSNGAQCDVGSDRTIALWMGIDSWSRTWQQYEQTPTLLPDLWRERGLKVNEATPPAERVGKWYFWREIADACAANYRRFSKPTRSQRLARQFKVSAAGGDSSWFYLGPRELPSAVLGANLALRELAAGRAEAMASFSKFCDRESSQLMLSAFGALNATGKNALVERVF